jgi:uncharacterized protein YkwD
MTLHKWFLPHRDTHQKAHLLNWEAILIYILMFVLLQVSFTLISEVKPGVLGTSSSITRQKIIELTNAERAKRGLSPVTENTSLNRAAEAKAANMFSENYWAHFAPSGKSPWDFMKASGYRFTFAGENLAKNFSDSEAIVVAWMNSPTHRENIVNPKYREIGIAVEDGVLNGQRTTLVVQMFGSTAGLASAPSEEAPQPPKVITENAPTVAALNTAPTPKVLINPFQVSKYLGLSVISLLVALLFIDFLILRRRGVMQTRSHHLAHMAILSVAAATLLTSSPGSIL